MDPAPAPYLIRINGHLGAIVLAAFRAMAPDAPKPDRRPEPGRPR